MRRPSRPGLLGTVATVAILGGVAYGVSQLIPSGPAPGQANVWVDQSTPNSCTRNGGQATAQPYDSTAACSTFQAAYNVAQCGDLILVKAGTYSSQDIWQNPKTCSGKCRDTATFRDGSTVARDVSGCVHIQSETTDGVTIGGTTTRAMAISDPYVWLDGINTNLPADTFSEAGFFIGANTSTHGGLCTAFNTHDVMLTSAAGGVVNIGAASYVFVEDSSFGPHYAVFQNGSTGVASGTSQITGCQTSTGSPPTITSRTTNDHSVFLRDVWHDYWENKVPPEPQRPHTECIHWVQGDYGVIAQSTFVNCDQYAISVENQSLQAPTIDYLLVENNLFEPLGPPPTGSIGGFIKTYNLACHTIGGSLSHSTFRYNSMDVSTTNGVQNDQAPGQCVMVDHDYYGNILPGPINTSQCNGFTTQGVTFHDNIFITGSTGCGVNNTTGLDPLTIYTDAAGLDYTEATGSASINYVPDALANAGNPAGQDRVGVQRPVGPHKDAGAYER